MTDSLCERALKEVAARCELILIASGYNTDLGANVLRARRTVELKASEPTAVVVWDAGDSATQLNGRTSAGTVEQLINVEVHTKVNQDNTGILISAMKADVKRAVMSVSSGSLLDEDGEIGGIAYVGSTPAPVEAGTATEYMTISFAVTLKEAYGNPNSSQRLNVNP